MGNSAPLTEQLVEKCYKRHPKEIKFIHTERNSDLDVKGIDFVLNFKIQGLPSEMNLQVKTYKRTIGFVLPLPEGIKKKIQKKIRQVRKKRHCKNKKETRKNLLERIEDHVRKHPDVKCILFVARHSKEGEEKILGDIWQETMKIAYIFMKNHPKK